MRLRHGVLLVYFLHLQSHLLLCYPIKDTPEAEYPHVYTGQLFSSMGLNPNPSEQRSRATASRLDRILQSYLDVVNLFPSTTIEKTLNSQPNRLSTLLMFPELREKSDERETLPDGYPQDIPQKRQQGWHINYGKRSHNWREDDGSLITSGSSKDLDTPLDSDFGQFHPMSDLLWAEMVSKFGAETSQQSPDSKGVEDQGDFRGQERSVLPRLDISHVQTSRLSKRQQGWHIPYGKRSEYSFDSILA